MDAELQLSFALFLATEWEPLFLYFIGSSEAKMNLLLRCSARTLTPRTSYVQYLHLIMHQASLKPDSLQTLPL